MWIMALAASAVARVEPCQSAQPLCFVIRMMTEWLNQLPQIDAAIADAEWRIERRTKFLEGESRQEALTSDAESDRRLEIMLMLAECLRHCRTAVLPVR
jgi:hypothetical protein